MPKIFGYYIVDQATIDRVKRIEEAVFVIEKKLDKALDTDAMLERLRRTIKRATDDLAEELEEQKTPPPTTT